jgi:hypothetical protein
MHLGTGVGQSFPVFHMLGVGARRDPHTNQHVQERNGAIVMGRLFGRI